MDWLRRVRGRTLVAAAAVGTAIGVGLSTLPPDFLDRVDKSKALTTEVSLNASRFDVQSDVTGRVVVTANRQVELLDAFVDFVPRAVVGQKTALVTVRLEGAGRQLTGGERVELPFGASRTSTGSPLPAGVYDVVVWFEALDLRGGRKVNSYASAEFAVE